MESSEILEKLTRVVLTKWRQKISGIVKTNVKKQKQQSAVQMN